MRNRVWDCYQDIVITGRSGVNAKGILKFGSYGIMQVTENRGASPRSKPEKPSQPSALIISLGRSFDYRIAGFG